jgi:hypothetical protein
MPERRPLAHPPPKTGPLSPKIGPRPALKADKRRFQPNQRADEDVKRLLHAKVQKSNVEKFGPGITVSSSAFFTILLGIVVVGGIAAIIFLRDLAQTFGVNWN